MPLENAFSVQNGDCFCMFAMETSCCRNVVGFVNFVALFFLVFV